MEITQLHEYYEEIMDEYIEEEGNLSRIDEIDIESEHIWEFTDLDISEINLPYAPVKLMIYIDFVCSYCGIKREISKTSQQITDLVSI